MNTRILLFSFSFFALGLAACQEEPAVKSATEIASTLAPVEVLTKQAGGDAQAGTTLLSGTIQSQNEAVVSARMMGYVTLLGAEIGDKVQAGQTLIRIENNELPAQRAQAAAGLAEAEAALKNVKLNYDRVKALWEKESVTRREWDDIAAQYEMTQAKVEGARQMKNELDAVAGRTIVKAPISGVLASKSISMGDLVNPGVPLMTIEGNKGLEVVTYVSDQQINAIKTGMTLDCSIDALGKNFKAVVSEIAPSAVNTGGQYAVKASLKLSAEERQLVRSGMYANVLLPIAQTTSSAKVATVAKSAIVERGQLKGIYTVSNQNTALLRWIRTGRDFGNEVEVVSGLSLGEAYIVSDLSVISDGRPVAIKN